MTYAFIIVVSVAITVKLLFLSFSMYFTLKNRERQPQVNVQPKANNKSMIISWRNIQQMFLRKTLQFNPDTNKPNYTNKI